MKKLYMFILLLACSSIYADDAAKKVAETYFKGLMTGNLESLNETFAVPFALDLSEILKKEDKVKEIHQMIVKDKGKRELPTYTTSVPKDAMKLPAEVAKEYTVIRFSLTSGTHKGGKIDIYLKKVDKDYKVIGFKD